MEREGYSVAHWLNQRGIAAFVLKYRLVPTSADPHGLLTTLQKIGRPSDREPPVISAKQPSDEEAATLHDAIKAIRYLQRHPSDFRISPDRIGFMGFSAGAYTTLGVALKSDTKSRPNLVAAIYGSMPYGATVDPAAPPAFIVAATDDPPVPVVEALKTYTARRQASVPAELHVFETGGHGFGVLTRHTGSDQWLQLFDHWLRENRFGKPRRVTGSSQRPRAYIWTPQAKYPQPQEPPIASTCVGRVNRARRTWHNFTKVRAQLMHSGHSVD